MKWLLRAAIFLGLAVPVFAASGFRPPLWQLVATAAIGFAASQLAWRLTQARSPALKLAVVALGLAGAIAGFLRFSPSSGAPKRLGLVVVLNGQRPTIPTLTLGDLEALTLKAGLTVPVARATAQLSSDDSNWNTIVKGTTPAYFELRGFTLAAGALPEQEAFDAGAKVVILGPTTAQQLFGKTNPVGEGVRIKGVLYSIAGVLGPREKDDDDDVAIIPLPTFRSRISGGVGTTFDGLFLSLGAPEAIRAVLRDRHRLAPGDDDDFMLRDLR